MPAKKKSPAKPKAPAAKSGGSKRPLNAYMQAIQKAKKENAKSFTYTSTAGVTKTYVLQKASTGLMVYKEKK